jgi:peptidoglycan/xylan/chitin deacetylase (PgdA/CDA1 family)
MGPGLTTVLTFHSVGDDSTRSFRRWQISIERLREHLHYLSDQGIQLRSLAECIDRPSDRNVAITFDDGFADFLKVLPLLQDVGASATVFVTTGYVGGSAVWLDHLGEGKRLMMSWADLANLPNFVEIGSHGRNHLPLDVIPRSLLQTEVTESRTQLEDETGRSVTGFCYPFGFHDRRARRAVERAGYSYACEVGYKRHSNRNSSFAVSRLLVTPEQTPERLLQYATGRRLQGRRWLQAIRPAHRTYRRWRYEH